MPVAVRPYAKAPPGVRAWEYDVSGQRSDGTTFRERRKSQFTSKCATERFARRRFVELMNPPPKSKSAPPTFAEFWPRYLETRCVAAGNRASSIESKESIYRLHLSPAVGHLRLDEITAEHIDRLKTGFAGRPSTGNNVLTVLNTILECAVDYAIIEKKPVRIRWFPRRRVRRPFYDFEQYERLLDRARKLDPRSETLVLLGGDGALRRGEILALEQSDIDYERGFITVERQIRRGRLGPPKGGVVATIPTTDRLLGALRQVRHLRGPRVLYRNTGEALDEATLRRWLNKAQRLANLKESGPHILRHTAISHMVMRGVNVRAVQEFARHADMKSTMGYMHLAPGHLEEAVRGRTRTRPEDGSEPHRAS